MKKLLLILLAASSFTSCTSENVTEQESSLATEKVLIPEADLTPENYLIFQNDSMSKTSFTAKKRTYKTTYDLADIPTRAKRSGFGLGRWHLVRDHYDSKTQKWRIYLLEQVDYWFDQYYVNECGYVTAAQVKKNGIELASNGFCYWISSGDILCKQ